MRYMFISYLYTYNHTFSQTWTYMNWVSILFLSGTTNAVVGVELGGGGIV